MPMFRVQLKQGSRTIVNHIEADTWEDVKAFYDAVSTMKVTEILQVVYQSNEKSIPVDNFNYKKLYKAFMVNENRESRQIIVHNIKKSINEKDISNYIKQYLKIAGKKVEGVRVSLFKI